MIEDWIDDLCKVWEISDQRFGTVKSYKLIGLVEFPDSIDAAQLDIHPIALTIATSMQPEYSAGGPALAFYTGVTEFHVAPDVNKSRLSSLLPWYGKILRAAAGAVRLGGNRIAYFLIADVENAIEGPVPMQYGAENPHWGFIVRWKVKEHLVLTVSA